MRANTIEAVYEDGVFKPLEKVYLKEHTRVRVLVLPTTDKALIKAQKSALKKIVGISHSGHKDTARRHNEYIYAVRAS